jgi:hypothetical protein
MVPYRTETLRAIKYCHADPQYRFGD